MAILAKTRLELGKIQNNPKRKKNSCVENNYGYREILQNIIEPAKIILELEPPDSTEIHWLHEIKELDSKAKGTVN